MLKHVALTALAALMLAGCGAAPTAPLAAQATAEAPEAKLADKFTATAYWHSTDQRPYMHVTAKSITGHTFKEDRVCVSTDGGKTGFISPLIMAVDKNLYIKKTTKEPRVYTYHKVGTYQLAANGKTGDAVTFKLDGKLKASHINIPMLMGENIVFRLDAMTPAAPTEPRWLALGLK